MIFEDIQNEDPTKALEKKLGLNFSWVSVWRDNPISVSITVLAFLDNHRVTTITPPAKNNNNGSAGTFFSNTPIEKEEASTPETTQAS